MVVCIESPVLLIDGFNVRKNDRHVKAGEKLGVEGEGAIRLWARGDGLLAKGKGQKGRFKRLNVQRSTLNVQLKGKGND
jgi:hypothetical protein